MSKYDDQVEAHTRDLIDGLYREDDEKICEECGNEIYDFEDYYTTLYCDDFIFCSEECKEDWEAENIDEES